MKNRDTRITILNYLREFLLFGALNVLFLTNMSCSYRHEKGESKEPLSGESTFSLIQRTIVQPKCLSCHTGSNAAWGIDLSSHSKMMECKVVIPFRPDQSKFFISLDSGSMPKNNAKLDTLEIQRVFDWINKGALESDATTPPPASPLPTPSPTPQPTPPPSPRPQYHWINENIFQTKCINCHRPPKPKGDVNLSSYRKLMDSEGIIKKPIVSGDPDESGIYDQVHRKKMPPDPATKLSAPEELAIFDWIKDGAKEN